MDRPSLRPRGILPGPTAWFLLVLPALLLAALWFGSPRFTLWINGEQIVTSGDPERLTTALAGWVDAVQNRPISLRFEGQQWSFQPAQLGIGLPMAEGQQQIARSLAERPWWVRNHTIRLELAATLDPIRLEEALQTIRQAVERAPVDAALQVVDEQVEITPGLAGVQVDAARLQRLLLGGELADVISLPVTLVDPAVTTESLAQLGVKRLIADWATEYDPSIPRAENVERAARAFDGLMLKPGEILSYNGTVGPVDGAHGWREALVIIDGELVPGIGGGVCQVATTLYGAALRANLEILERHPHQLAVSYIPPSEDAAVAQGYQDLKIRNNTLGHLLLKTEAGEGRVRFRLYGDLPAGQAVRIESQVTGTDGFSTRRVLDPSLAPGQEVAVSPGARGVRSEAYRQVWVDGEMVKRELLSRDRYLPTAAVVKVGPPPP